MSLPSIRVLIAEDELEIIHTLYIALPGQKRIPYQIEIVALSKTGADILELAEKHRPDIAILDQVLPRACGAQAAKMLAKTKHPPRVIMYTGFRSRLSLEECLEANIRGFVDKCNPKELLDTIELVYNGGTHISAAALKDMYNRSLSPVQPLLPVQEPLTARETAVLKLLQKGLSQGAIAEKLSLRPATVKTHLKHLREKAQCASLKELRAKLAQQSPPPFQTP